MFRMKVKDKNFGIETPGETVYFKMVSYKAESLRIVKLIAIQQLSVDQI